MTMSDYTVHPDEVIAQWRAYAEEAHEQGERYVAHIRPSHVLDLLHELEHLRRDARKVQSDEAH